MVAVFKGWKASTTEANKATMEFLVEVMMGLNRVLEMEVLVLGISMVELLGEVRDVSVVEVAVEDIFLKGTGEPTMVEVNSPVRSSKDGEVLLMVLLRLQVLIMLVRSSKDGLLICSMEDILVVEAVLVATSSTMKVIYIKIISMEEFLHRLVQVLIQATMAQTFLMVVGVFGNEAEAEGTVEADIKVVVVFRLMVLLRDVVSFNKQRRNHRMEDRHQLL